MLLDSACTLFKGKFQLAYTPSRICIYLFTAHGGLLRLSTITIMRDSIAHDLFG
jgi:hypothetical protein